VSEDLNYYIKRSNLLVRIYLKLNIQGLIPYYLKEVFSDESDF